MPPTIIARRAAQSRALLARGVLAGARVPLRNGRTFPAELFAKVMLDDLDRLTMLCPNGDGRVSGTSWRQLAEDIELLHEVSRWPEAARSPSQAGRPPDDSLPARSCARRRVHV